MLVIHNVFARGLDEGSIWNIKKIGVCFFKKGHKSKKLKIECEDCVVQFVWVIK
jgi:hypothetical protein